MKASLTEIPIASIRLDGGTQPRAALDFDAIEDYADAMGAGAKFPPVTVFYDGTHYWLADGFHRVKAAYAAGFDKIECEVHQGTINDAQWYSFGANKTNGLRRTNQDKQRAVKAALAHANSRGLSDRGIAKHVGVSHQMVAEWRAHLSPVDRCDTRTVTRSGTTYRQNTTNIGRRKSHSAQTAAVPEVAAGHDDPRARQRLEAVLRAVQVIAGCEAEPEDLARLVASWPDRDRVISSMEKANDFLELCTTEARRAEGLRSSSQPGGEPAVAAGPNAGCTGNRPAMA